MPIDPWGLGNDLFQRIQDRVRNELGVETVQPTSTGTDPNQPGLLSRIKQRVHQELYPQQPTQTQFYPANMPPGPPHSPQPPPPPSEPPADQPPPYQGPPRSLAEVKARIQQAGRQRPPVLLRMLYNGQDRDVEPYSYRYRDADDPHLPLFYGYCHKDHQIEAYKLKKIQDLQVTNRPYQPRWPVEF